MQYIAVHHIRATHLHGFLATIMTQICMGGSLLIRWGVGGGGGGGLNLHYCPSLLAHKDYPSACRYISSVCYM